MRAVRKDDVHNPTPKEEVQTTRTSTSPYDSNNPVELQLLCAREPPRMEEPFKLPRGGKSVFLTYVEGQGEGTRVVLGQDD